VIISKALKDVVASHNSVIDKLTYSGAEKNHELKCPEQQIVKFEGLFEFHTRSSKDAIVHVDQKDNKDEKGKHTLERHALVSSDLELDCVMLHKNLPHGAGLTVLCQILGLLLFAFGLSDLLDDCLVRELIIHVEVAHLSQLFVQLLLLLKVSTPLLTVQRVWGIELRHLLRLASSSH
jgi:hypothetical protein